MTLTIQDEINILETFSKVIFELYHAKVPAVYFELSRVPIR